MPDEVVVLRPGRAQRLIGAGARAMCAAPLLIGALFTGDRIPMAVAAALVAAAVVFVLDLVVRRSQAVELRTDALVADEQAYPWWSIDSIDVRRRTGRSSVALSAFGLDPVELVAPRTSVLAHNPDFDADVALITAMWGRLGGGDIDLRDRPVGEPLAPVEPIEPARRRGRP